MIPLHAAPHELTFEQRVAAQRAIEQVSYGHQKEAVLAFDEAVPRELLERKVRDYLRQSASLQRLGTPGGLRWREPTRPTTMGTEHRNARGTATTCPR